MGLIIVHLESQLHTCPHKQNFQLDLIQTDDHGVSKC